ncbi:unnamed protein product [Prunus armeniaca]
MRRCLERQERETNERSFRRAERQRLQREEDQQVVIAVTLLDEENQGRRYGPNVDRHMHSRGDIECNLICSIKSCMIFAIMMHTLFKSAARVLGLLPEQKLTAVIQILAYGSSADQVNEIARLGKSTIVTPWTRGSVENPAPASTGLVLVLPTNSSEKLNKVRDEQPPFSE